LELINILQELLMSDDTPDIAGYKLRNDFFNLFLLLMMASLICIISWLMADSLGVIWILFATLVLYISWPRLSTQKISNAYATQKITPESHPELLHKIHFLANNAGLENMPEVYRSEFEFISAFTIKVDNRMVIVVSSGLIEHLDNRETMAVLAHEISHIYHNDINFMQLVNRLSQFTRTLAVIGLIALIIAPFLSMQNAPTPWTVILVLLFTHYTTGLIQLSLSRSREFYADVIAVQLTNDIHSMVSALNKIEHQNTTWFNKIIHPQNKFTIPALLRSYPSTQDRIRSLHGLGHL
jgi:heat shock protein HtpX